MGSGEHKRTAMLARLEEYARLRDSGVRTFEAATAVGVGDKTRSAYERWYRSERGLPRRQPDPHWGDR